ncbi:hypothetical protein [Halosolutus halophilus]|uniref:hypothetical protein n=1 Tax=Halosolutus halophilus TaxID=1552990 RepID=UPI0022351FE9|nr:hypothetical protein [Halosolutus halophilus]
MADERRLASACGDRFAWRGEPAMEVSPQSPGNVALDDRETRTVGPVERVRTADTLWLVGLAVVGLVAL